MWHQNEEKNKLVKLLYLFMFLVFIVFMFFPFSLILLFFGTSIKNYFVSEFKKISFEALRQSKNYENIQDFYNDYSKEELREMNKVVLSESDKNTNYARATVEKNSESISAKEIEKIKNENTSFYEQNTQTLKNKFSQQSKQKKSEKNENTVSRPNSWRNSSKSQKNYFWNTKKKSTTFGSWKSIWDNYESVTTNFSANNKTWK